MRSLHALLVSSYLGLLLAAMSGCSPAASEPGVESAVVVNEFCPIMGGKVSQDAPTVDWNGSKIGFCCDGCDEKFLALSDEEKTQKLSVAQAKASPEGEPAEHDHS